MSAWDRLMFALIACAACLGLAAFATNAKAQVSREAERNRRDLTRISRSVWGLSAPVATFGAQIEQESGWNAAARSGVGAQGIAQFMPSTVDWLAGLYPDLAAKAPLDPRWAMLAMARYDRHLWERFEDAHDDCERWAFALASYNGGLGWIIKARHAAHAKGIDSLRWFGAVEAVNPGRSATAQSENAGYPKRILHDWEPRYFSAGWLPAVCN